ncbi:MAG: DUF5996 family protein [Vicinamibacterales bacterium]
MAISTRRVIIASNNREPNMAESSWPALPYAQWKDTCETLHMWMQVIGKVAVAASPPLNHCWGARPVQRISTGGAATWR